MVESTKIEIDPNVLVTKLNKTTEQANGDLARVIELLLLENHVLELDQSCGFRRSAHLGFSEYPRFLKIDEPSNDELSQEGEKLTNKGDLAQ